VAAPIRVDAESSEHSTRSSPVQVYVFTRSTTTATTNNSNNNNNNGYWTEQAILLPNDGLARGMQEGGSVAVSDDDDDDNNNVLEVGANGEDENRGSSYVFVLTNAATTTAWTELARLTASDAAADDSFGGSVGISGDTIVFGAEQTDADRDTVDSGIVYVFARTDVDKEGMAWTG